MDFDATTLYSSAMWDDENVYPKIETEYPFTLDMKDELVEKFNSSNFNQDGALLKAKYYNPADLIFQQLLVKERVI